MMDKESFRSNLSRPVKKSWYSRWWGITLIFLLGIFGALSVASGFYVFTVAREWRSGGLTLEQILGISTAIPSESAQGTGRPEAGNPSGTVTLVAFIDFEGPPSKRAMSTINQILSDPYYGQKLRVIFRYYPNPEIGSLSLAAAATAECGHRQGKFKETASALFDIQSQLGKNSIRQAVIGLGLNMEQYNECIQSSDIVDIIQNDMNTAAALKIETAPTFVIEDKIVEGAPTVDELKKAIDLLSIKK